MPSTKKRGVPSIVGHGFKNPRDPTAEEYKSCIVPSFERATETALQNAGWNGGLYGTVGLQLANDNRSVLFGHFRLYRRVFHNALFTTSAAKFWSGMDEIKLELDLADASIFSFTDTLVSNLVDSSNIAHRFLRGDIALGEDELEDLGVTGFCLRAFVNPTRETYAKIAIGLLPFPLADLLDDHPLANNILYPAISVGSAGEFPLGPPLAAAVPRARDRWGCPFWPLVVLGTAQSACPILPPGSELRGKIAEILRKSIKPELKNGPATLLKRMDEIREAGASNLKKMDPEKLWPLPTAQPAPIGQSCLLPFGLLGWILARGLLVPQY